MATDKPRIQAYTTPDLYKRFLDWKLERGISKDSEALNELLAEYFGVSHSSLNPQSSIEQIEEIIQEECDARMQAIKEDIAAKLPSLSQLDEKISGYVREQIQENHRTWIDELAKRFHERIFRLEQEFIQQRLEFNRLESILDGKCTKIDKNEEPTSLTQSDLARRLGIDKSRISRRKDSSDFSDWSREKDPEAIAWKYDREKNVFLPV